MKVKEHHSAGIVVYRLDESGVRKYLLLHYPSGHWDYAKGHLDEGEDIQQAAVRELVEETGISDVILKQGLILPMYYEYKGAGFLHKKKVDYLIGQTHCEEGSVVISHEHQGFGWYKYEEAMKQLTFDNARDVLLAAESFLSLSEDNF